MSALLRKRSINEKIQPLKSVKEGNKISLILGNSIRAILRTDYILNYHFVA